MRSASRTLIFAVIDYSKPEWGTWAGRVRHSIKRDLREAPSFRPEFYDSWEHAVSCGGLKLFSNRRVLMFGPRYPISALQICGEFPDQIGRPFVLVHSTSPESAKLSSEGFAVYEYDGIYDVLAVDDPRISAMASYIHQYFEESDQPELIHH